MFSLDTTLCRIFPIKALSVLYACHDICSTLMRQQHEHFKPTEILLEIDHVDNDIAGYSAAQRIKLDC